MEREQGEPTRFIGLDIHKHYLVATGVDGEQATVFGPQRVPYTRLERWIADKLTEQDAVVIEMTTNSWEMYDALVDHVHSVTVVHPPHVTLITRAQVMTDRKASLALAQLLAAGLLVSIWVPPVEVRDLRALIAHRRKMVNLTTSIKNRLHSVLHRHHIAPPEGRGLFTAAQRDWWLSLPVTPLERFRIESDLDTLAFAQGQIARITTCLAEIAGQDERLPILAQIAGIGMINGMTVLAAIGVIDRFPDDDHLVGYAGLGARVHDSGLSHKGGRITKSGRRDLRGAMVEAAQTAARTHPHWKAEFRRLERRIGKQKAKVAVARKLLIAVWHVLSKETADRFATDEQIAKSLLRLAYKIGAAHLHTRDGHKLSAKAFTRYHLDRMGIGREVTDLVWSGRRVKLPPSMLPA